MHSLADEPTIIFMPLDHIPLKNITRADIDRLIQFGDVEDRKIEYKQDYRSSAASGEVCFDISAFANGIGGDILYGIPELEESGNKTGKPESAKGMKDVTLETVRQKIEPLLSSRVQPRLPPLEFKELQGEEGIIAIVRVPKSWNGPHIVRVGEDKKSQNFRCYIRNGGGNGDPLDVQQLRNAFIMSSSLPQRIREFRNSRLQGIPDADVPVRTIAKSRIVIHIVSLANFEGAVPLRLDPDKLNDLPVPYLGSRDRILIKEQRKARFNLEGFLYQNLELNGFDRREWVSYNYVQIFRSGCVEIVDSIDAFHNEMPTNFGRNTLAYISKLLSKLDATGFNAPAYVMMTLLGVANRKLYSNGNPPPPISGSAEPFERSELMLPECLIEDFSGDIKTAMLPAMDALWQAGGFSGYFER